MKMEATDLRKKVGQVLDTPSSREELYIDIQL